MGNTRLGMHLQEIENRHTSCLTTRAGCGRYGNQRLQSSWDRTTLADGTPRVDFQRTRASKSDPCSRYYAPDDFDVVAACLHSVVDKWEFRFVRPVSLDTHKKCVGKLSNNVKIDDRWLADPKPVLAAVV